MQGYNFRIPSGFVTDPPVKYADIVGSALTVVVQTASREDGQTILLVGPSTGTVGLCSVLQFEGKRYALHRYDHLTCNMIFHPESLVTERVNPNTVETWPTGGDRPQVNARCTCVASGVYGCRIHDPNLQPSAAEEVETIRNFPTGNGLSD